MPLSFKATVLNETLLQEEGIEYAECFVSLTDVDEENILLSLYVASMF